MLRNTKDLEGYAIDATDGEIGHVRDFYFDERSWVIRYLIVDTGEWLASRKVLISPIAAGAPNRAQELLPVSITREQVRSSPDIDTDKPVTRQHEMEYSGHYGYPYYWSGTAYWGSGLYPNLMLPGAGGLGSREGLRMGVENARAEAAREPHSDPHLRSCNAVVGYHIHASDGEIGHVWGLLMDEETWAIRYMVVDTSNWWLGHKVLIAPAWIKDLNWVDSTVWVNLTRQAVKDAPAYDPAVNLDRVAESRLHDHYGQVGYWAQAGMSDRG